MSSVYNETVVDYRTRVEADFGLPTESELMVGEETGKGLERGLVADCTYQRLKGSGRIKRRTNLTHNVLMAKRCLGPVVREKVDAVSGHGAGDVTARQSFELGWSNRPSEEGVEGAYSVAAE